MANPRVVLALGGFDLRIFPASFTFLSTTARVGQIWNLAWVRATRASTMFNRLPGAMLKERHTRECRRGRSCGRALWHDTAAADVSHRLFNPAPPEARLACDRRPSPLFSVQTLGGESQII